ncbi:O-antigen ligase family protein [Flagellimonas lutimaris]|uniref:O-antigen ligase family protein n=1 Tax=Flagellimonas lutimaris TaxID=475082 RepID=A0A3A1N8K2_9FLAO|nr:O-antigen ligase family protein [Allomuricauda lutimaris]RIV34997.1 O-antigen ligase family protein [Allomuricauda lutimaris]
MEKYSEFLFSWKQNMLFLFCFIFPISQQLSTVLIGVILLLSILNPKREFFTFRLGFLFLGIIYLVYGISLTYSQDFQPSVLELKASLLVFPIIFFLDNRLAEPTGEICKYFVLGCIFAVIICEINAIYHSIDFQTLSFESSLDPELGFMASIPQEKNYFFSQPFSFLHQTVYFAMYLLISLVILLKTDVFKKRIYFFVGLLLIIIALVQLLNKASFITLAVLFFVEVADSSLKKKTKTMGFIAVLITGIVFFIANPRFSEFNMKFSYDQPERLNRNLEGMANTERSDTNTRILLWMSAWDLIKEHPIIGIGAGGSHRVLYETLAIKQQHYDRRVRFHAHNQYLQVLLDLGILGFLIFFLSLFFLFKGQKRIQSKPNRRLMFLVLLIFLINFLFESVFERYSGISSFSFFASLMTAMSQEKIK